MNVKKREKKTNLTLIPSYCVLLFRFIMLDGKISCEPLCNMNGMAKPFEFDCGSVMQLELSLGSIVRSEQVWETPSTQDSEQMMLYDLPFRLTEYILFDSYVMKNDMEFRINVIWFAFQLRSIMLEIIYVVEMYLCVAGQVVFVWCLSVLLCSKPDRVPSSFRRIQAKFLGEIL